MHKVSSRSERVTWGTYNIFVKLARIKDICNLVTNIEAVVQTCSVKKMFLEISQNSQENTCARVSFLIKLQAWPATLLKKRLCHKCFPVNFVNTFLHWTPLVAASVHLLVLNSRSTIINYYHNLQKRATGFLKVL